MFKFIRECAKGGQLRDVCREKNDMKIGTEDTGEYVNTWGDYYTPSQIHKVKCRVTLRYPSITSS
jgi:hypothetical protein